MVSAIACTTLCVAQSGRSYGPGRVWWDAGQGGALPWEESYDNPDGQVTVLNRDGVVRADRHAFFEALGRNGRACITCHQPSNAMSVSASAIRERWVATDGKDPVFAAFDGANCPEIPQYPMSAHSLLVERGLFRIPIAWPPRAGAEFRLEVVRSPAGCKQREGEISVYRRPRITANLGTVLAGPDGMMFMADGRERSLQSQAIGAILGHEQAPDHPTLDQLRAIVAFESQVFAAQSADIRGGLLNETGGPGSLSPQNLAVGKAGSLASLLSFAMWRKPEGAGDLGLQREFRASVAHGSEVFRARCASCHTAGTTRWIDIGTANTRDPESDKDLPLFRVICDPSAAPNAAFGRVFYTHDPGRGAVSGKCADVGAIALQQFRGLSARPPYFANGSARTLADVVDFYVRRREMKFTPLERQDLINFLRVL